MSQHKHTTEIEIAGVTVEIAVEYGYVPGAPEEGPSYASGGQPAEPIEIDVHDMKWSRIPGVLISGAAPARQWHAIECRGPLFDLIADQLREELIDNVEDVERF
jgi:hypothetical protein